MRNSDGGRRVSKLVKGHARLLTIMYAGAVNENGRELSAPRWKSRKELVIAVDKRMCSVVICGRIDLGCVLAGKPLPSA